MPVSSSVAVVEDSRYAEHRGPVGHPERPDRLKAVARAIAARSERLSRVAPRPAQPDEILRVHSADHLALVQEAASRAPIHLDPDTFVSPESLDVALLAAGASIDLARAVARREIGAGLAAVRPPGHHAEASHAMGFCLFNNAAIAARALQADEGVERILLFDWDVHHGNGTQHSFEADPSILYASTHQFPYYPGTGAAGEAGRGAGEGATLNVPLPAGCGDDEYVGALQRLIVPAALHFRPEMLLISCGFDAHRDDPLAAMEVSGAGFSAMASLVRSLADELCGGRVVFLLEGGYALSGLEEGTAAVLDALLEPDQAPSPTSTPVTPVLGRVVEQVVRVHGGRIPDLGAV